MIAFLSVLLVLVLLALLGVLATGVFVFAKGGDFNRRHGNRLMNLR
ncbi:MAG: twin transmembrane helix small protein, partial [Alphaproteobacteria bacterium]|nr:twin transmembrane helix small protein [Alphaproteobacteria bacterium]